MDEAKALICNTKKTKQQQQQQKTNKQINKANKNKNAPAIEKNTHEILSILRRLMAALYLKQLEADVVNKLYDVQTRSTMQFT